MPNSAYPHIDMALLTLDERTDMDNARFARRRERQDQTMRELGEFRWADEDEE